MSGSETSSSRSQKSAQAYRTIGEVSEAIGIPQHVLRFWEEKFSQIRPMKRGGGRRYYRPEDVDLIERIHTFLYRDGYTIKGVQKLLKEQGRNVQPAMNSDPGVNTHLQEPLDLLTAIVESPPASAMSAPQPKGLSPQVLQSLRDVLHDLYRMRDLIRR